MDQHSDSPQVSRFAPQAPRLLDRLRDVIRAKHYSRRTEKTYRYWVRYFIFFHGKRHPEEMGAAEITSFLNWLASERNVAAATQNQALNALLFLYRHVLERDLPWLEGLVRAKRPVRLRSCCPRPRCAGCWLAWKA